MTLIESFRWNLTPIISSCSSFIVYVGGFLEEIATILKTSRVNCGSQPFPKGMSNFEMRTLSPILNLGFLNSRSGLLYRVYKKSDFFTFFGIESIEHFLSQFSSAKKLSQFVNVLISIVFHVMVKYIFQGSYCTFNKCSLGLTYCRVNLYSFSFA